MIFNEDEDLINELTKYLHYSDIKYFTIKSILNIVKCKSKELSKFKLERLNEQANVKEQQNSVNTIANIQNEKQNEILNDQIQFTDNVTKLLLLIKLPLGNTEKGERELNYLRPFILDDQFKFNYESASNLYSDTWLLFLSFKVMTLSKLNLVLIISFLLLAII